MSICKNCNQNFTITDQARQFYHKIDVPEPVICADCRRQQLLAFWPFGQFYSRKCDKTGENIISTFPPQAHFPVYKKENWLKDDWQPSEVDLNLEQSFLKQLSELQKKSPHYHMLTDGTNFNCDYCDDIYSSKNCYLTRSTANSEDLHFCYRMTTCKDSLDCVYSDNLEKCYSCTRCWYCYNTYYCLECRDCLDSYFLYDCRGCRSCFICWNLRNAEHCIKNKQYSAADYQAEIKKIQLGSWQEINRLKDDLRQCQKKQAIHRQNFNVKTITSDGNYLVECKNCSDCFFIESSEDCCNIFRSPNAKDVYDSVGAFRMELCYLTGQSIDCYNIKIANYAVRCRDSEYLDQCEDCTNCFGCVGLRKRKFCILNKQYSETDYSKLVKGLKDRMKERGEYGQFFPYDMTYNGYNDTLGYQYFPATQKNIQINGGWWQEEEVQKGQADLQSNDLPDLIQEVEDDKIIAKTILCPQTGRVFRYIPQELKFYHANNVPLPRYYYNYRITQNFKQMMPLTPRKAYCNNCSREITTYYPAEWGYEKIYCEECYKKEIY
ncbi:MAG: hypothetical protein WC480_04620 [Patescibacteria group bacterium]